MRNTEDMAEDMGAVCVVIYCYSCSDSKSTWLNTLGVLYRSGGL